MKKHTSHTQVNLIMGKYAALPTIAKSYEKTMMMYYNRFVKDDPNVNK